MFIEQCVKQDNFQRLARLLERTRLEIDTREETIPEKELSRIQVALNYSWGYESDQSSLILDCVLSYDHYGDMSYWVFSDEDGMEKALGELEECVEMNLEPET